jgi:hypothetical protein
MLELPYEHLFVTRYWKIVTAASYHERKALLAAGCDAEDFVTGGTCVRPAGMGDYGQERSAKLS